MSTVLFADILCYKHVPVSFCWLMTLTLLLHPRATGGACCTTGQPIYNGSVFRSFQFSSGTFTPPFPTCSDGPCSGVIDGVAFNYIGAPGTAQSDNADSCCFTAGMTDDGLTTSGWFYNPQRQNGPVNRSTSWLGEVGLDFNNGSYIPGTGLMCNIDLPRMVCSLQSVDVPTCASAFGSDPSACDPSGLLLRVYNSSTAQLQLPDAVKCCRSKTCAETNYTAGGCPPGYKYNNASANQQPPSEATCCMRETCADLAGRNGSCPTGFTYDAISSSQQPITVNFTVDCCQANTATCREPNPATAPGQRFQCDGSQGWQYDARKDNVTNPASQQDCCAQSSCADVFPLNDVPNEPWNCSAGFRLKANPAGIKNANETNCCEAVAATCKQPNPVSAPTQQFTCDGSNGWQYDPRKENFTNPSRQEDCCVQSSCADVFPLNDVSNEPWNCSTGFRLKASPAGIKNANETNCCEREVCADQAARNISCSAGFAYNATLNSNKLVVTNFTADCCEQLGAPTCADRDGNRATVDPWPCVAEDGWVTNTSAAANQQPSNSTCCARRTCADTQPFETGSQQYNCTRPNWVYDQSSSTKSPPTEDNCCKREVCADQAARNISCPAGFAYNATLNSIKLVVTNFTADCCEQLGAPTCADRDGNRATVDPWPCVAEDGWVTNTSAAANQQPSNSTCCARGICADTQPFETGSQRFNCTRPGWVYDQLSDTKSPPTEDICCKAGMPTCGNWDLTGAPYPCDAGTFLNEAWRDLPNPSQQTCCSCNCTDGPFTLVKSGPESVSIGEAFKYSIVVAFFGAASNVVVTDNLPKELMPSPTLKATWVARSASGVVFGSGECQTASDTVLDDAAPEFTCNLQSISCKPGDLVEIEVPVIAGTEPTAEPVVNWAYVRDGQNRTASDNATVVITDKPQVPFVLTKLGPGNVTAGQEFMFGVTVTFLEDVTGAVVTDILPNGLTRGTSEATWIGYTAARVQQNAGSCTVSDTGPDFTCPLGSNSFTWRLGDTIELSVPAVATGLIRSNLQNTARIIDSRNRTAEDRETVNVMTVDPGLGFMIIKSGPGTISVNEVASFQISVIFFDRTSGVRVVDNLPAPLLPLNGSLPTWVATVSGSRSSGSCSVSPTSDPEVSCSFSSLTFNTGDMIDIKVPVITTEVAAGVLTNLAVVTDDKDRSRNSTANVTIIEDTQPTSGVLAIVKACPSSAPQNEAFTCEITVVISTKTSRVVITDDLPSGLVAGGRATWVSYNVRNVRLASGECDSGPAGGPEFTCTLNGVTEGFWNPEDKLVVSVPVVGTVVGNGYINMANATDSANRKAYDDAVVNITAPRSPFTLVKSGPGTAYVNQPFVFRVSVLFFSTAVGVIVTDDLPAGLLVPNGTTQITWGGFRPSRGDAVSGVCSVSPTSPEYICNLGDITWNNGDRVEISIPAVAPSTATNLVNNATVRDSLNRVSWDISAVSVVSLDTPRLLVNKYGPGGPCNLDTPFTFTVAAGVYPGSPPVNPLILVDELQTTDAKFVDPIPSNCTKKSDQRIECRWDEPVGPSDTKLVKFSVIGTKPGSVVNNAIVSSPGVLTMNDTAEAILCNCPPNITIPPDVDKQGPGLAIREGQLFNWTITADVPGVNKSTSLTLTDQIPANSGFAFTGVIVPATLNCPTKQPNLIVCVLLPPFPQTVTIQSTATRAGSWLNSVELRSPDIAIRDNSTAIVIVEPPLPSPSPQLPVSPSPSVPPVSPSPDMFIPTCARYTRDGRSWVEVEGGCSPPTVYNGALTGNRSNMTDPNIGAPWVTICCTAAAQSVPVINIRKSADKERYSIGQTGTYTIVVTSESLDTPALGVKVNDTVPAGLTPVSDSWRVVNKNNQRTSDTCAFAGQLLTCNLGDMSQDTSNPSQTKTITFRFTVKPVTSLTIIRNTAWASCSNTLPGSPTIQPNCLGVRDSDDIQVEPPDTPITPENTVQVRAAGTDACPNKDMRVTITADPGLNTARGVTVVMGCSSKVTIKKITRPESGCRLTNNRITCFFTRLTKASTIIFQVTGNSAGRYTCNARARVRGNTKDINKGSATGRILAANNRTCVTQVSGACCINPNRENRECLNSVSQSTCTGRGGRWRQSTRCDLEWCPKGAAPPPPAVQEGQCCRYPGTSFAACSIATQAECTGWGTQWQAGTVNGQCAPSFCPGRNPDPISPVGNCQCQSCGFPGAQWPTSCCSGFYCGTSGNRWSGYSRICLRSPSSGFSNGISIQATCSSVGNDCSRATGQQCCEGANLDCIMQPTGKATCSSRSTCAGLGSSCKGLGTCCGGLMCGSNNRCRVAECRPESSCRPGDKGCSAQRLLECEVMYVGALGSPVDNQ